MECSSEANEILNGTVLISFSCGLFVCLLCYMPCLC